MDRDVWRKAMTQFTNLCGASPVKNQIRFFDGHDSLFKNHILRQIKYKKIQPFVLKSGDSINNRANENVPNSKLKYLYNVVKSACILMYGRIKFSPHQMNSVLVEACYAFKVFVSNIIRDRFVKQSYPSSSLLTL